MHKKLLFWGYILSIGMVLCSVYGGSLYASTINVPGDYSTIRDALSAAGEGDIIIVAPGTYAENIEFQGKNVTLRSQDPENPDIVSRTILNLSDKHSIHFSGEEGPSCRVAGFTIQGIILGNYAKPTIEHNRIEYPGSMGMENLIRMVNGRIANNEIINITMTSSISKIFSDCNGIIENNNISGNIFTGNGSLFSNCNGLIRNNIIEFNFIAGSGSPLYNCKARIENNIIRHNDTLTRGGAAYGCTFLRNNIIYGNRAYQGGALAYCSGVIENNVIYGNDAQHIGGGLIHVSGSVRNNIVWGNTSFYMSSQSDFSSGLTYNCIEGWSEDDTNITDDPGFIDPENGDFHLMPDSPCIDAGDPTDDYNMTFNDYLLPPGQGTKRNDMGAYGGQHNHGWTGYHEAMLGVITPHRDIWGAPNYGFAPFGKPYRKGWPGFSYRPQEMIYPLKGDPDGDGDDDIVQITPHGDAWVCLRSETDYSEFAVERWGWLGFRYQESETEYGYYPLCADVNGNGLDDLIQVTKHGDAWVALSAGQRFRQPSRWGWLGFSYLRGNETQPGSIPLAGDVNGNGRADLIQVTWHGDAWVALSVDNSFEDPTRWGWLGFRYSPSTGYYPLVGDFNGDGLSDLCQITPSGDPWVSLSDGTKFLPPTRWGWLRIFYSETNEYYPLVGDVNADGKDDLIQMTPEGQPGVSLSKGDGFEFLKPWGNIGFIWSREKYYLPFYLR